MTTARSRTAAHRLALTAPMVTGFKVLIGNGGLSSLLAHSFYFFSRTYICVDLAPLSHVSGVWVDGQADRWIYLVAWTSNIGSQTHAITIMYQGVVILVICGRCTCDFYHATLVQRIPQSVIYKYQNQDSNISSESSEGNDFPPGRRPTAFLSAGTLQTSFTAMRMRTSAGQLDCVTIHSN